jgi:hypothetical protein
MCPRSKSLAPASMLNCFLPKRDLIDAFDAFDANVVSHAFVFFLALPLRPPPLSLSLSPGPSVDLCRFLLHVWPFESPVILLLKGGAIRGTSEFSYESLYACVCVWAVTCALDVCSSAFFGVNSMPLRAASMVWHGLACLYGPVSRVFSAVLTSDCPSSMAMLLAMSLLSLYH